MFKFKSLAILAGVAAALLSSSLAHADLVLLGPTPAQSLIDLSGQGFGAAPRMLTLQTDTFESGGASPNPSSTPPLDPTNPILTGNAVSGANKTTTPTLSTLGWNSGYEVGIGFNSDQTGKSGITLDTLVLTIYGTDGTTVEGTFSLASAIDFSESDLALQQGNGKGVFGFVLDSTEQATFNNILAMSGSSGFFAGLSSSLGCAADAPASCMPSNDGPDSFGGFVAPAPAIGHGLPGVLAIGGLLLGFKLWERGRKRRSLGTALAHAAA